jgi:hypothetical protein
MSIDPTIVASLPMAFEVEHVSPADSDALPNPMLAQPNSASAPPSLSHSLTDPLPDFSNLADQNAPMHVPSSSNLAPAAFIEPTALDPIFPSSASSTSTFISDFNSPTFPVSTPVENGMAVKLPTSAAISSPLNSVTIHGTAFGTASSFQSALDSSSAFTSKQSSTGILAAPPVALPVILPSSAHILPLTLEALKIKSDETALAIGRNILDEVVQSASAAADLCSAGRVQPEKIVDIVDHIIMPKLAKFKELTIGDAAPSPAASMYMSSNGASDYPTPGSLPAMSEASDSFPLNHQLPALHPQVVESPHDLNRKRCVPDIADERRVKQLKTEPQDDTSVSSSANGYPTDTEMLSMHGMQSPPDSRQATPAPEFIFNPLKPVANYPPAANESAHSPNPGANSMPKFPPLRSAWSESVVSTRHSHSMSTGSISVPSSARATETAFSHRPLQPPVVPGRMTRSGSIGEGFSHPFTFSYAQSAHQPGQWRSAAHPTSTSTSSHSPEEDGGDEYDDEDSPGGATHSQSSTSSDVPQEYRSEVDRIFFEYLNKTCSNLDATDSKGESIHQTLMAKKMQRLDESPDFRPFKFRIQAFTNAFLDELAKQGYPEEKIPMKKIRNYLWRHPYIQRYNEDGRKAKSKGNHIWNVEARKAGDGRWEFRPFHRKLAGPFPGVAYCGLRWHWKPRIWDPQASWQNIPVFYSSPILPSWLSWKGDELSGVPPPDAQNCDITVIAKFILDGQENQISHTFHINIAPRSAVDPAWASRASPEVNLPRVSSEPMLSQLASKSRLSENASELTPARVVEVLQNVATRVAQQKAEISFTPHHTMGNLNHLAKQKHAVEHSLAAYDLALIGPTAPETHRLAVAAQSVVVEAAQHAIAPRAAAAGITPTPHLAIANASIWEMTDLTQEALAVAVSMQGNASNDLAVIETTSNILANAPKPTSLVRSSSYVSLPSSAPVSTLV